MLGAGTPYSTLARVVVATLCLLAMPASALADEYVVGFAGDTTGAERADALGDAGVAASADQVGRLPAVVIEVPDGAAPEVRAELLGSDDVRYVQPNGIARALWSPNDPLLLGSAFGLPKLYGPGKIGAPLAWNVARGAGTVVAVVDTGVDATHEDLQGQVVQGYDFVDDDADASDVQGHGTHVAGTVAATADNGLGVAGIAPSATVLAVRVLGADGSGSYSDIAAGIQYAADQGADVINLSLGGESAASVLADALSYANARGAVVTCAAGNNSTGQLLYPAAYAGCFSVGSTTSADAKSGFSNWGSGLDIAAPGSGITSTVMPADAWGSNGEPYSSWNGTSMATPHVSGLAALLAGQGLSRTQIISTITGTATDLGSAGYDTSFGWGRIDAAAAVAAPRCSQAPVVTEQTANATITPVCTDADQDPGEVTWTVVTQGSRGTVTPSGASLVYDPTGAATGADSFVVRPKDASGNLGVRLTIGVTINAGPNIGPPETTTIVSTSTATVGAQASVSATWQQAADPDEGTAANYALYYSEEGSGEWWHQGWVSGTSDTLTGLTPGTTYQLAVVAYDSLEAQSAASSPVSVTPAKAAPRLTLRQRSVARKRAARQGIMRCGATLATACTYRYGARVYLAGAATLPALTSGKVITIRYYKRGANRRWSNRATVVQRVMISATGRWATSTQNGKLTNGIWRMTAKLPGTPTMKPAVSAYQYFRVS